MTDQTYNGWTNYETWNIKLWIDNDQGEQEYWLELAEELETNELMDIMKETFRYERNPLADEASMYSDILGAALSDVNWREIAAALKEDAQELA